MLQQAPPGGHDPDGMYDRSSCWAKIHALAPPGVCEVYIQGGVGGVWRVKPAPVSTQDTSSKGTYTTACTSHSFSWPALHNYRLALPSYFASLIACESKRDAKSSVALQEKQECHYNAVLI